MKLSQNTLAVLSNFSKLSSKIMLSVPFPDQKTGEILNQIRTVSDKRSVYSEANIEDEFPVDVRLLDIKEFIFAHSFLQDPEVEFLEKHLEVSDERSSITIRYADHRIIDNFYTQSMTFSEPVYTVDISADDVISMSKAMARMGLTHLKVTTGDTPKIIFHNPKETFNNQYSIKLPEPIEGPSIDIDIEELSLLPKVNYKLEYTESPRPKCVFRGQNFDIKYVLPVKVL